VVVVTGRARATGLLIATWLAAAAAPAAAGPRLSLGLGLGGTWSAEGSPGGPSYGRGPFEAGYLLRYEQPLTDRFALAATGSHFIWTQSAAKDAGYDTQRVDLGVAPVWRIARRTKQGIWLCVFDLDLSFPVGVSVPIVRPPTRRAASEHVEGQTGWFVGATLRGTLVVGHVGLFLEYAFQRSATGVRSVVTPRDGSAPADQTIGYVDLLSTLIFGGVVAF
jgi:hypothetical protein